MAKVVKNFILLFLIVSAVYCSLHFKKLNKNISEQTVEERYFNRDFFEEKIVVSTNNEIINSIFNHYDVYKFNSNYICQLEETSDYLCFITKNSKNFEVENNICNGITFYYPNKMIFIADNQNSWLDSNLILSDKYLIHELAHAYTNAFCGSRKHDENWVSGVESVLKQSGIFDSILLNDIINEYGYKR